MFHFLGKQLSPFEIPWQTNLLNKFDISKDYLEAPNLFLTTQIIEFEHQKLFQPLSFSFNQQFIIFHLPFTFKLNAFIQNFWVSDNLFLSFWGNSKIIGRKYLEKDSKNIREDENTKISSGPLDRSLSPTSPPLEEYTITEDEELDFFAIIYPILEPPLDLNLEGKGFLPYNLYPFQKVGIERLITNSGFLLADEMGTGKTVMGTVALRLLIQNGKVNKVLIVCPVSVINVWVKHIREWAPRLRAFQVTGNQTKRETIWKLNAHVYITSYASFSRDVENGRINGEELPDFDLIILDEAQSIKNPKSKQSRILRNLTAKFKWALTGTPLENHLGDVLTIFDFLHPGYLPINQSKELTEEFVKNNIAIFMLRRLKRDVMKDLPPKIRQDIFLSLNPAQSRAYNKVLEDQKKGFIEKGQKITKVDILSAIQVLKQICNFPPHQQENSQTNSPKMLALREIIDEIEKGESKLLVFSQYTRNYGIAEIERLLNQPDKVCKLIGGMSESERTKVIDRFKNDSSTKVMLISVKAGGTGLTLIEASYVVHFDQWWNPAVSRQAEDRAHRKGQKAKAVNIYEFWMINTIEERIHRLLKDKGLLADRVIDSLASPEELATKISITDLLGVYDLHQESTGAIVEKLEVRPEDSEHDPMKIPAQTLTLSEIQQRISELTPDKFEILIAELMKKLGFENVTRTGKSGDGGIDVIGYAISESGPSYTLVQCKHYSRQKVGVGAIRDFYGAVTAYSNDADGIMMSSGDLSQQAIDFAKTQTQGRVGVFQGLRLINMIKQFNMYI